MNELHNLITDEGDRATLIHIFKTYQGGMSQAERAKTTSKLIDLKRIYGGNLDRAVAVLLNLEHSDNLTESGETK